MRTTSEHARYTPSTQGPPIIRGLWAYPPARLVVLTILALLLAMGSARGQTPPADGPSDESGDRPAETSSYCSEQLSRADDAEKWQYFEATCALAELDYRGFIEYVPENLALVIDEGSVWDAGYVDDDWRTRLRGPISDEAFGDLVAPILDLLVLSDASRRQWKGPAPLVCNDSGLCEQKTDEAHIQLRFDHEDGVLRLIQLRADYADLGC